jgi:hypothetical protein
VATQKTNANAAQAILALDESGSNFTDCMTFFLQGGRVNGETSVEATPATPLPVPEGAAACQRLAWQP